MRADDGEGAHDSLAGIDVGGVGVSIVFMHFCSGFELSREADDIRRQRSQCVRCRSKQSSSCSSSSVTSRWSFSDIAANGVSCCSDR